MKLLKIKTSYFNLDHLLYADIIPVHEKGYQLTLVFNSPLEERAGDGQRRNFKTEVMLDKAQLEVVKGILDAHLIVFYE